jgi:hypothetical protein
LLTSVADLYKICNLVTSDAASLLDAFVTSLRFLKLSVIAPIASLPVKNALAKLMISGRNAITSERPAVKLTYRAFKCKLKSLSTPTPVENDVAISVTLLWTLSPDEMISSCWLLSLVTDSVYFNRLRSKLFRLFENELKGCESPNMEFLKLSNDWIYLSICFCPSPFTVTSMEILLSLAILIY